MLKTKNPYYNVLLYFVLVLLIPTALLNVRALFGGVDDIFIRVNSVLAIIGLLGAFVYMVTGFSKKQAWLYLAAVYSLLLIILVTFISELTQPGHLVVAILYAVALALAITLAIGKDLGQKKSLLLCLGMIVLLLAAFIRVLVIHPDMVLGQDPVGTVAAIRSGSDVLHALVLFVLVFAKYVDKTARGTK